MKRFAIFAATIAVVTLTFFIVFPLAMKKAKAYSGPSLLGNLRTLQLAKDEWQITGHTNEWPKGEDLFPEWTRGRTINDTFRRRYGEIYFINRTGAPPFAYIPKASGPYRGGELLVITSNGLAVQRQ